MTIIEEQAPNTRAKRRIDPSFRPEGGPLPHGKPKDLPVKANDREEQINTEESGLQ